MAPLTKQSNPDMKQAVIASSNLLQDSSNADSTTHTSYETPEEWIKFRRGLQEVLKSQNVTQGPPSYAVANTLLKGNALTVFKQAENKH
eukprot:5483979-Ditylum_brightwellii.AAC.1